MVSSDCGDQHEPVALEQFEGALRLVFVQHTMIGMAVKLPLAARNNAAYCKCLLSCTTSKMMKPVSATANEPTMNAKRIRIQSDATATTIADTNAQAHGGTESNWLWIALFPIP